MSNGTSPLIKVLANNNKKILQELRATRDQWQGLAIFETDADNRNITVNRNLSKLMPLARQVRASYSSQELTQKYFHMEI